MLVGDIIKDPNSTLDYVFNWDDWMISGDYITLSEWLISPSGVSPDLLCTDGGFSTSSATVWLTEGVAGNTYRITNRITTNCGREDDRTIVILVRER